MKLLYLILFLFTPLIFTSFNSELFELPKMYFVYSLTILILGLHLIKWVRHLSPLYQKNSLLLPFLLFLSSQIVSTLISVDPYTSIFGYYSRLNGGLLSLISYFLLSQILIIYLDPKFRPRLITASLISGFLVSAYGLAQHLGIDKHLWVQDVQNRVFSTLGQPNWLAAYLCILLPFSVDRFLNSETKLSSTIYYLLSTIYFLCLLFTKSQSGILAAIISLGIYFIFLFFQSRNLFFNLKSYILILIITVLSLAINNPIQNKLLPSLNPIPSVPNPTVNITPSENIRKIVWQGAVDLWQKFPLFGTGVETFAYSYYWTRPASHNLTSEWDFLYNKAHNEYLNYLATTGTFGFITYLLLIIFFIKTIFENCKPARPAGGLKIENLAILSSIASILITNFAGFSVVISSLYFYTLPILSLKQNLLPSPKNHQKKSLFSLLILIVTLFLLQKAFFFYLADITYSHAEQSDSSADLSKAYHQIKTSLAYRPNEPLYLIKSSLILAKLALSTHQPEYISQSITNSDKALSISPANTNFWKERAQIYYYLSSLDAKYLNKIPDSLLKAAALAPTDAKTYYLLGQFYDTIKNYDPAIKYYQQAIGLKPNYDHTTFALAKIYFDQKDYPQAKTYFELTLSIAPNNIEARDYLDKIKN